MRKRASDTHHISSHSTPLIFATRSYLSQDIFFIQGHIYNITILIPVVDCADIINMCVNMSYCLCQYVILLILFVINSTFFAPGCTVQ